MEDNIRLLEKRTKEALEEFEKNYRGKPSNPRILITGCPSGGVRDKIIKVAEEIGMDVVGFESCSGPREKADMIDETKDPLHAIAEKYLRVNCSVMSPNPDRFRALDEFIEGYQIDGVLEVILHACHTFAVEAATVEQYVKEKYKIPYLCITTDYSMGDSSQVKTRLGAFAELLRSRME